MEERYELFCTTDPSFYDQAGPGTADDELFTQLRADRTPEGWDRHTPRGWISYRPRGVRLPRQGWKIHVSATLDRAAEVVRDVFSVCVAHRAPFKVVPGPREYHRRNGKYGERAGSGKLVTVYPLDNNHLRGLVLALDERLHGVPGPYVLSDLRWQDGPVYVRYGAFVPRMVRGADGQEVVAIEDPGGNLVPDPRGPVFSPPDWVELPAFLRPALERRDADRVDSLPFEVVRALHYSNGGGVYEGRLRDTGARVAVKEARPHAGLDGAGRDAVTRLRRERDLLERLRGLPGVPRLLGYHALAGHEFLVEEFVTGEPLYSACARRNPLLRSRAPQETELAGFRDWAMGLWQRVAGTVRAMHARGVVFGDLHLHNILYPSPDDEAAGDTSVWLIDFEGGWLAGEDGRQLVANPGFAAPRGREGTEVDEYALAALKIALFAPLTALVPLNPDKADHLAEIIADRYGVPLAWFDDALTRLRPRPAAARPAPVRTTGDAWPALRDSLAAAIRASASPDRADRVFPGDIEQFSSPTGGLGLAYGAAGVLWALKTAGAPGVPEAERWLLDRITHHRSDLPDGFYTGRHGIAYALWDLGRQDEAAGLLDGPPGAAPPGDNLSLFDGLSGIGLNWLRFAGECGDDRYLAHALDTAAAVRDRLGTVEDVPERSGGPHPRAGLLHGSSGPALFLTAVYEATGDPSWLDAARTALRQDLRRCTTDEDGALHVNEGFRLMPYLEHGSAGIGFALARYLAARPDPELADSLAAVERGAAPGLCVYPGLFTGYAGLLLFHARKRSGDPAADQRRLAGLDWHAMDWQGHAAFPGTQLLRLSMDLATGGAGVLLALAATRAAGTRQEPLLSLPFLLPPAHARRPAPGPTRRAALATP